MFLPSVVVTAKKMWYTTSESVPLRSGRWSGGLDEPGMINVEGGVSDDSAKR